MSIEVHGDLKLSETLLAFCSEKIRAHGCHTVKRSWLNMFDEMEAARAAMKRVSVVKSLGQVDVRYKNLTDNQKYFLACNRLEPIDPSLQRKLEDIGLNAGLLDVFLTHWQAKKDGRLSLKAPFNATSLACWNLIITQHDEDISLGQLWQDIQSVKEEIRNRKGFEGFSEDQLLFAACAMNTLGTGAYGILHQEVADPEYFSHIVQIEAELSLQDCP